MVHFGIPQHYIDLYYWLKTETRSWFGPFARPAPRLEVFVPRGGRATGGVVVATQAAIETESAVPLPVTHAPFWSELATYGISRVNTARIKLPEVDDKHPLRMSLTLPVWKTLIEQIGGHPGLALASQGLSIQVNPSLEGSESVVQFGASLRPYAAADVATLTPSAAASAPGGLTDNFSIFRPATNTFQFPLEQSISPILFPYLQAGNMPTLVLSVACFSKASATVYLNIPYVAAGPRVVTVELTHRVVTSVVEGSKLAVTPRNSYLLTPDNEVGISDADSG